ncbi:MAG: PDZ domain-containing protein [Saprospirales bacterium]|nr:PDZ domain-containing protein [Saprospirales bacterium]
MKRFLLLNLIAFYLLPLFCKNTGFLGVVINDYNKDGVTGVSITNSIENGAAQKFGLLENDVITTVNNIVKK